MTEYVWEFQNAVSDILLDFYMWYHDAQVTDIAYSYLAVDRIVTLIILVTTMKNISFERIFFCLKLYTCLQPE